MIDLATDIRNVLDPDAMARPALRSDGVSVNVILHRVVVDNLGNEFYRPWITCATADVSDLGQGDRLTIDGIDYLIAGPPKANAWGVTRIDLTEAP